jgi:hypothetical protein
MVCLKRLLVLVLLMLLCGKLHSQSSAFNLMEKRKWDKARAAIEKSIRKDSLNPAARFAFACYFFEAQNPSFHIDSAYQQLMLAMNDFEKATEKERERLKKSSLDSLEMVRLRQRIDSAAFQRALSINAESAYIFFLDQYTFASQRARAIELRNEVAYLDALKANTYQAFAQYLQKYPQSERAAEADRKYQRLLYESKTADHRLAVYEQFVKEHAASPYLAAALQNIFEISTADGQTQSFVNFIKKYPNSPQASLAKKISWHLFVQNGTKPPDFLETDSLRKLNELNSRYLVPFLQGGKFGLMNNQGTAVFPATTDELTSGYLCGNITEDVLAWGGRLVARNGAVVFDSSFTDFEDAGAGFLMVEQNNSKRVVHKSGWSVWPRVKEARILDNRWVALRENTLWSLYSLAGRQLLNAQWTEIDAEDGLIILRKGIYYYLVTSAMLAGLADRQPLPATEAYVHIRFNEHKHAVVKKGSVTGVIDKSLKPIIDWTEHPVETFFGGYLIKKYPEGSVQFLSDKKYANANVNVSKPWVSVYQTGWQLLDHTGRSVENGYDSVIFRGPYAIGFRADSAVIHANPLTRVVAFRDSQFRFIPGADSLYFLEVDYAGKKTLLDRQGDVLYSILADKIDYAQERYFSVTIKNKKGLVDSRGNWVLPAEYDGLGFVEKNMVPLLKDRKFGLAALQPLRIMKPQYEKNVVRYNDQALLVFKGGKCGLVGWDNKPITAFDFDEIRFWNDTTLLVRRNYRWAYYNLVTKKLTLDDVKDFSVVRDSPKEKIFIIHHDNYYGVMSSKEGILIAPTFSLIKNLGSDEEPLYFAEKHVEEASVYVVVYYNKKGEVLKRLVFEEDEYEKIICDE